MIFCTYGKNPFPCRLFLIRKNFKDHLNQLVKGHILLGPQIATGNKKVAST
jgi:hypothetical protein